MAKEFEFYDNPLSYFDNVSYRFKLYMIPETVSIELQNETTADRVARVLERSNKIIIGETGASTINIQDVEIRNVVAANPNTLTTTTQSVSMRLFEPMGMSLLDRLLQAARTLGISNYTKTPIYLELSFHGYDTLGNYIPLIGPTPDDGGKKWYYRLVFRDIKMDFTETGTFYDVELVQFDDLASMDLYFRLTDNFIAEVGTLNSLVEQFIEAKRKEEEAMYTYARNEYRVNFLPLQAQMADIAVASRIGNKLDPGSWTFERLDDLPNRSGSNENLSEKEAAFGKGQTLESILRNIFIATKEGQKLACRTSEINTVGIDSEYIIYWSITPTVEIRPGINSYDIIADDYNRIITYNVIPKLTPRTTATQDQQQPIKERNAEENKRKYKIRSAEGIRKKYDYLFTGLNTEVLNIDLKFDMLWKASLPTYSGSAVAAAHTPAALQSDGGNSLFQYEEVRNRAIQEFTKLSNYKNDIEESIRSIQNRLNDPNLLESNREFFEEQIEIQQQRLQETEDRARIQRQQASRVDVFIRNQRAREFTTTRFLDESPRAIVGSFIPITIDRSVNEQLRSGRGEIDTTGGIRGQAITTSLLNQLESNQLLEINLEIRGDPYWLGRTHLERERYITTDPMLEDNLAPYINREVLFVLTFKIPEGLDHTGDPTISKNETFTGVYLPRFVVNRFTNGAFNQVLEAVREVNVDINPFLGSFE